MRKVKQLPVHNLFLLFLLMNFVNSAVKYKINSKTIFVSNTQLKNCHFTTFSVTKVVTKHLSKSIWGFVYVLGHTIIITIHE